MKNRILYLLLTVLCLGIITTSCTKETESDTPNENHQNDNDAISFEGTYSLTMTYDSITSDDGTWISNADYEQLTGDRYDPEHGYMTVSKEDGRYHMIAVLTDDDSDETVTYFDTYATESNGILVMENSSTTAPSGVVINFSFRNFANDLPHLYFKGICSLSIAGYDFSYLIAFDADKQQKN